MSYGAHHSWLCQRLLHGVFTGSTAPIALQFMWGKEVIVGLIAVFRPPKPSVAQDEPVNGKDGRGCLDLGCITRKKNEVPMV